VIFQLESMAFSCARSLTRLHSLCYSSREMPAFFLRRLQPVTPVLRSLQPRRTIVVVPVDRPAEVEKAYGILNRRLRFNSVISTVRSQKFFVKGAEKSVLRKERKDHLQLKSKVHALLNWVEFKQKYRVE